MKFLLKIPDKVWKKATKKRFFNPEKWTDEIMLQYMMWIDEVDDYEVKKIKKED